MADQEVVQGRGYEVDVIRTDRSKSARVQVEDGSVSIIVPAGLAWDRITKIVADKHRWIKEKLYLHQQTAPASSKEFVSGEAFTYLGRNYRLKIEPGAFQPAKLRQGRLVVTIPKEMSSAALVRNAVVRWYRLQAQARFSEKVTRYSKIIGVKPASVAVKTFKSRWGSCTVKNEVLFHWKVIQAPHRIVDYVVVHELCHLKHHDHSVAFWRSVEAVIPDYLKCKEWLKQEAHSFNF